MRFWGAVLVIFVPAIVGEAVFLGLIMSQSDTGGGDAKAELLVGGALAGVLALAASLIFLRAGLKSLLYALAAAVLVYPLWFAFAIVTCLTGECS